VSGFWYLGALLCIRRTCIEQWSFAIPGQYGRGREDPHRTRRRRRQWIAASASDLAEDLGRRERPGVEGATGGARARTPDVRGRCGLPPTIR
jgi:hypothetical protein